MALTSNDENDLILPLFTGTRENPRFSMFLERLLRRSGADHVSLVFRQPHAASEEETVYFAGLDLDSRARESGVVNAHTVDRAELERLRPGRVYATAEFDGPGARPDIGPPARHLGIADERFIRIVGDDGLAALMILARSDKCSAADSALLSNLAPFVAAAMANFVALEGQRVAVAMASEGLERSGTGWILFDKKARILAIDPATRAGLLDLAGIGADTGHRLRDVMTGPAKAIAQAAADLSADAEAPSQAVVLSETPRIEAILKPASAVEKAGMLSPAMLAICRLPRPGSGERAKRLASLFELPSREAELAIALADGHSIAEAARAMGLTLETARNYSKRLYAKMGVRGQAELVRQVYESSAVLA